MPLVIAGELSQNEWAAWVQAVGSVVAIAVAIAVPFVQTKHQRRRELGQEKMRARSMAMSLLGPFQEVADNLNDVWDHDDPGSIPKGKTIPLLGRKLIAIHIPAQLSKYSDRLHELGIAADTAQRCLYHLRMCHEYVTEVDGKQAIWDVELFYDNLWHATLACNYTLARIDEMFREKITDPVFAILKSENLEPPRSEPPIAAPAQESKPSDRATIATPRPSPRPPDGA